MCVEGGGVQALQKSGERGRTGGASAEVEREALGVLAGRRGEGSLKAVVLTVVLVLVSIVPVVSVA